jgi:hypothetical protein
MKPVLGWTMLSWEEMRQVERALSSGEQDTRDEIGFLLIHQGFADRFFPGTSVLHTRIRYALFIPWLYRRAAYNRRRGVDLETMIRRLLVELAIRLKQLGGEPFCSRVNTRLLRHRNERQSRKMTDLDDESPSKFPPFKSP